MGEQGAALQKYNQELVKCIEQIKLRRSELLRETEEEEDVKSGLEFEINQLQTRLDVVLGNLRKKRELLDNCDRALKESETAFMKILESSQVLLTKVLRESEELHIVDESQEVTSLMR